ncbi:tail fiber domain-containing protein [Bacillus sp. J37]|uniref:tail fiber domain-containing protein n=1 Tax=Bacillus sp. J37 TaxID=935837 RepID=UPI00047DDBA4|nr:tail fiber domain-containing protein [Bacillus sp. J37]
MNRRNFLVNFLLWILSFVLGYRIGHFENEESKIIIEDKDGKISNVLDEKTKQIDVNLENLKSRGLNIKYPPKPLIGAKVDGETDDTEAIRKIIEYAEENNIGRIVLPGVSVITGEIEVKKSILIEGIGAGSGYSTEALTDYRQVSGFLVKGKGKKRIRTRVNYRASVLDSQDNPLSVALNIQAENVELRNFSLFLDFNRKNNSPTNYGVDWDIGLFIGCRVHTKISNVHILGYWREASIYLDVTRGSNLPEFIDLKGKHYERGTVTNGADGLTLESVYTQGGKWGLKIQGAKPKKGKNTYTTKYYDEISGKTVTDSRGYFGSSDITALACSFYGTNHHSRFRRDDSTGDYLTDKSGGAVSIDGLAGNSSGALQGMRFISCRFSTWEPFRIKLDRVNRPVFVGCHSEGGSHALTRNGSKLLYDDSDYYGPISTTENTQNLVLIAFNSRLRPKFIGAKDYTNISPANTDQSNFDKGIIAGGDSLIKGELTVNGALTRTKGEMDIIGAEAVRLRHGNETIGLLNKEYATFFPTISIRPSADNVTSLGIASNRFSQVYAGTGSVNTSDRNVKTSIRKIPDEVLNAWSEVNYSQYKFIDAVEQKGPKARLHIGIIAQEIEEAFKRHGLNAFDYGILGYDEWENSYEEIEEEVEVIINEKTGETKKKLIKTGEKKVVIPSGSRYSIRPDECLMLESALMRRELEELKNKLQ